MSSDYKKITLNIFILTFLIGNLMSTACFYDDKNNNVADINIDSDSNINTPTATEPVITFDLNEISSLECISKHDENPSNNPVIEMQWESIESNEKLTVTGYYTLFSNQNTHVFSNKPDNNNLNESGVIFVENNSNNLNKIKSTAFENVTTAYFFHIAVAAKNEANEIIISPTFSKGPFMISNEAIILAPNKTFHRNIILNLFTPDPGEIKISENPNNGTWQPFKSTVNWELTSSLGPKTIYVFFKSPTEYLEQESLEITLLDINDHNLEISNIAWQNHSPQEKTNENSITMTWDDLDFNYNDDLTLAGYYYLFNSENIYEFSNSNISNSLDSISSQAIFSGYNLEDKIYYFHVAPKYKLGETSFYIPGPTKTYSYIEIDNVAPTSLYPSVPTTYITGDNYTLHLGDLKDVSFFKYKNGNNNWWPISKEWAPYSPEINFKDILEGENNIDLYLKDEAGNITKETIKIIRTRTDLIYFQWDLAHPLGELDPEEISGYAYAVNKQNNYTITNNDLISKSLLNKYATSISFSNLEDGTYYLHLAPVINDTETIPPSLIVKETATIGPVLKDTVAPQALTARVIDNNNQTISITDSPSVMLQIGADETTGCQMLISNTAYEAGTYEDFKPLKLWSLTPGYETKVIYISLKDRGGNIARTIVVIYYVENL